MLALGFALALSAIVVAGIVWQIRMADDAPLAQRLSGSALPVLVATLIALLAPVRMDLLYQAAAILGLVLAVFAVGILGTAALPSYTAYAFLLITYCLFWLAFAAATTSVFLWPAVAGVLLIIAVALLLYRRLARRPAELWSALLIFGLSIALALWQALQLVVAAPGTWQTWPALLGMLLIAIAHTSQALNRFQARSYGPGGNAPMLPLLLAAHLCIAWSVW